MQRHKLRNTLIVLAALIASAKTTHAGFTDCATSWSNFDNPGFVSEYTYQGQVIADEETSADSSHGPAAVTPRWTDLASGSPGSLFQSGPKIDRLQILYDNANRQDITDVDAARVGVFTALHTPDGDASCTGGSLESHTRRCYRSETAPVITGSRCRFP